MRRHLIVSLQTGVTAALRCPGPRCQVDLRRCGGFLGAQPGADHIQTGRYHVDLICIPSSGPATGSARERPHHPELQCHDREKLPARRYRKPHVRHLGGERRVQGRPPGTKGRRAVHHRDPAAERDGLAAHGPRAQQHAAGHSLPLRAHARPRRAVAARHRPCRHRDPDGGRAAVDGAAGAGPARHRPRQIPRTRLAMEGRERRHHRQPVEAARRLLRLVARALHDGRRPVARGREGVRRAAPRRPDLQGQAAGQLGPEAADRDLRSRGAADRGQGQPLVSALSDRGQDFQPRRSLDVCRRGDDAAGDDARRHRRRGASGQRADRASDRPARRSCRWSAAASRSSATTTPIPRRDRARSRSRRRTTSTTSRSASGTACRRSTCSIARAAWRSSTTRTICADCPKAR